MKLTIALSLLFLATALNAQTSTAKPFTVEYYYKVKWGHQQEFLDLFKKNHYPLLKRQVEMGRMTSVKMDAPRYHNAEESRWDYRVTIVFKDAAAVFGDFDEQALIKQIYPDQVAYKKEEQRRFEVLDAHWDLPLVAVDLDKTP